MPKTFKQPEMKLHKATGNAYIRYNKKQIWLGKFGTPEAQDRYDAAILEWRRENDVSGTHTTTVGQLCLAFIEYADSFYVGEDGEPTDEADNFRKSLRHLLKSYRSVPCSAFGPRKLVQLQTELAGKFVRPQVNKHISRIKTVFRWGIVREMVPEDVIVKLDCVRGLPKGRGLAKESEPKQPVPEADFVAAVEQMTPNVAAICKLLRLSAARVSEVRTMCVGDIDTSGPCWILKPQQHTWISMLLPYFDQAPLYNQIDFEAPAWGQAHVTGNEIPALRCPSDTGTNRSNTRNLVITNYAASEGYHWWSDSSRQNRGVFTNHIESSIRDIVDGTSNTVAIAEVCGGSYALNPGGGGNQNNGGRPRVANEAVFRSAFVAATFTAAVTQGMDEQNPRQPYTHPDGSAISGWFQGGSPHHYAPIFMNHGGINNQWSGANSYHEGGIQVLMADGAVRFVSENLDWGLWRSLGSVNGGETIGEF